MPKLWVETIEAHRRTVRDAILDTTAALVAEQGLASVTMSQIAEQTGVGRATLYKYFSDVDAILVAWHERHVAYHLEYLAEVRDRSRDPGEQLEAVLEAYALISQERSRGHHAGRGHPGEHNHPHHRRVHHSGELAALVHRTEHVAGVERRLNHFMRDLLARATRTGAVRDDVPPQELARYCLHSLAAAGGLQSRAAVRRLVGVTLAGLRPSRA
jgi:AcrR family transcriptional regulator